MLLAACSGGGINSPGSNAPLTGTPTPAPAPTPTPAPLPTAADSAEYKASASIAAMKAAYAYDRSINGNGVTIAVIDTGIKGVEAASKHIEYWVRLLKLENEQRSASLLPMTMGAVTTDETQQ